MKFHFVLFRCDNSLHCSLEGGRRIVKYIVGKKRHGLFDSISERREEKRRREERRER